MKTYTVCRSHDWEDAAWLTDFQFPWRKEDAPETRFRARHDGDMLFFEFWAADHDLVLHSMGPESEQALGSDRVEIFFSTDRALSLYYGLEMDLRGMIHDYRARFHRQFDPTWNCPGLKFQGALIENGYRVEGSLSLQTLRDLGVLKGAEMIAGVYRAEFSHLPDGGIRQDWIAWIDPQTSVPDFHVPQSFGLFVLA